MLHVRNLLIKHYFFLINNKQRSLHQELLKRRKTRILTPKKSKKSVACVFCKTHKQTTAFFETMTEVHKERKDFEKMKKEDLISECLNLNKLLLQLKDENAFLRQQNNKTVDNLIDKVNEKTSNQMHDNNKVQ